MKGSLLEITEIMKKLPDGVNQELSKLVEVIIKGERDKINITVEDISKTYDLNLCKLYDLLGSYYILLMKSYTHVNDSSVRQLFQQFGFSKTFIEGFPFKCDNMISNDKKGESDSISFKWRIDLSLNNEQSKGQVSIILQLINKRKSVILIVNSKSLNLLRHNISIIISNLFKSKHFSLLKK